jgi:soluble P-type ATPase
MAIEVSVPGPADLQLQHLLLDVNGTLANRGQLIAGAQPRIEQLRPSSNVRLLSSEAFGTFDDVAQHLGDLPINRVSRGEDKSALATKGLAKVPTALLAGLL